MTIAEIHKRLPINRGLQEHMLRVGALAKVITDFHTEVDRELIMTAALLHDVGNIVKITFDTAPELLEPEGVEHWKERKAETVAKYGTDDHIATSSMLREVGINETVIAITEAADIEFLADKKNVVTPEKLLMHYCDMRVGLHGVISLKERIADIHNRYVPQRLTAESVDLCLQNLSQYEAELFSETELAPADITDELIAPIMSELLQFEVTL